MVAALVVAGCGESTSNQAAASPKPIIVGLITKTDANPFFVKMRQGAEREAAAKGAVLMTGAGKDTSDAAGEVTALENMVSAGAKAILITPDSAGVTAAVKKARSQGVLVIALDSPTDPVDAADALFATDNKKAGQLIGQYAKAAEAGKTGIKIAMFDEAPGSTVGKLRHDGFLLGYGISDGDSQIVCTANGGGNQTESQTAMENCLTRDSGINVVYTINEPSAFGSSRSTAVALASAG
jgi:fructose transport system substrate-binding protein